MTRPTATHGYLGHDPVCPEALRAKAHEELARYSTVSCTFGRVATLTGVRDRFELALDAVGDLTPGVQLVANAVANGSAAGVHCAHSLLGERP